jgi:dCMP deaminase
MNRLSAVHYGLILAQAAALRSTCPRRRVGAVLTLCGRVVATGFNGSSPGMDHCDDIGCLMVDNRCVLTTHAEQNALGRGQTGDTLYCTDQPCLMCLKLALANGVKCILYMRPSNHPDRNLFVMENQLEYLMQQVDCPTLTLQEG